jgi:hypothetical protein
MHRRAALACSALLFAIGCSDGTEPLTGPSGVFGPRLMGVRSGMLSGSAEAQEIFIETGSAEGSDTAGIVSVAGSFRAKVFP